MAHERLSMWRSLVGSVSSGCSRMRYLIHRSLIILVVLTISMTGMECDPHDEPVPDEWLHVSVGACHTCGIKIDGTLLCWGVDDPDDNYDKSEELLPIEAGQVRNAPVSGSFVKAAAGALHSCAIRAADSFVTCWGANTQGSTDPPEFPMSDISSDAAGQYTCGVSQPDGYIKCWGYQSYKPDPPDGPGFIAVSSGFDFACALHEDGTIQCWGINRYGQSIPPDGRYVQISAGYHHACALDEDGDLDCWGSYECAATLTPQGKYQYVSAGLVYTCAIRTDGKAVCWGGCGYGERTNPPSSVTFRQISTGLWHTCGITTDGEVICWGSDSYGESTPP